MPRAKIWRHVADLRWAGFLAAAPIPGLAQEVDGSQAIEWRGVQLEVVDCAEASNLADSYRPNACVSDGASLIHVPRGCWASSWEESLLPTPAGVRANVAVIETEALELLAHNPGMCFAGGSVAMAANYLLLVREPTSGRVLLYMCPERASSELCQQLADVATAASEGAT